MSLPSPKRTTTSRSSPEGSSENSHDTVLEVDLEALRNNARYYRRILKERTKLMGMVKAFSYGLRTIEVPRILVEAGFDFLGVAFVEEGAALRKAGFEVPVMVMNPGEHSYGRIVENDLEPEIYSFRVLRQFEEALETYDPRTPYPIHLKLETGMRRLGFEESELPELISRLQANPAIKVRSILSHLSSAKLPGEDAFTRGQVLALKRMANTLEEGLGYAPIRHIANSAGASRFPEAHLDMVRIGIGLYGVPANEEDRRNLSHVCTLKTRISQIRKVEKGTGIGYDQSYVAKAPMHIAILPLGYGDGLSRHLGNHRHNLRVNGHYAPIVGNVCMDMTTIDVTDIPCGEGDEVIIFDDRDPITEIARAQGTIPYAVLTGISSRVQRVFKISGQS